MDYVLCVTKTQPRIVSHLRVRKCPHRGNASTSCAALVLSGLTYLERKILLSVWSSVYLVTVLTFNTVHFFRLVSDLFSDYLPGIKTIYQSFWKFFTTVTQL